MAVGSNQPHYAIWLHYQKKVWVVTPSDNPENILVSDRYLKGAEDWAKAYGYVPYVIHHE